MSHAAEWSMWEFTSLFLKEKVLWTKQYGHWGHYNDAIMGAVASQITRLTIVCSTVYSDADQRKHQSSASLAFVRGIHRGPVNSLHKWPVTRKMFPFDDVIMCWEISRDRSFEWRHPSHERKTKWISEQETIKMLLYLNPTEVCSNGLTISQHYFCWEFLVLISNPFCESFGLKCYIIQPF